MKIQLRFGHLLLELRPQLCLPGGGEMKGKPSRQLTSILFVCFSFGAILYICFANAVFFLRQKFECQFQSPT